MALAILCLFPFISSPVALILGFVLASIGLVPDDIDVAGFTKKLLSYSIIGLGFGINLDMAIDASRQGFGLIVGSIFFTLVLGYIISRLLQIESKTGHLVSVGTAICGGSAIAAVSPAIDAKAEQSAIALACVFILNSVALFVFPVIGHLLALSQYEFGLWAAIAIHDTSSVVGAASAYGDEALKIATTIKLARALWIIPIALLSAFIFGGQSKKIAIPYFIGLYCVAILIGYLFPQGAPVYELIFELSKRTLVVCLFFIGCGITVKKMRASGAKPMLLAVSLWLAIACVSLWFIR